jgi:DegV family protein with EDD domain
MDRKFILSCCSTVDLPYDYMESRQIPVLSYTYMVDGVEHEDDMGRDPQSRPRFYAMLAQGKLPQTSQINVARYMEFFESLLQKGDVLHLAFTSGQSASVNNAYAAAEELRRKYPGRKLIVVDTLCSSSGYGLIVDMVADLRDRGATIEEAERWTLENRNKVHHQFFSSNMTQFHRTGRVSGAAAAVASILNICPLMRLDAAGAIKAYDKVRGKKKAIAATVDAVAAHAQGGIDYDQRLWVCHSECPEDANAMIAALEERFPKERGRIQLCNIGPVIGSHAGTGTVAVFFMGDERPVMD